MGRGHPLGDTGSVSAILCLRLPKERIRYKICLSYRDIIGAEE